MSGMRATIAAAVVALFVALPGIAVGGVPGQWIVVTVALLLVGVGLSRWKSAGLAMTVGIVLVGTVGYAVASLLDPTSSVTWLWLLMLLWWQRSAERFLSNVAAGAEEVADRLALPMTVAEALHEHRTQAYVDYLRDVCGLSKRSFPLQPIMIGMTVASGDPAVVVGGLVAFAAIGAAGAAALYVGVELTQKTWLPAGAWKIPQELLTP